MTDYVSANNGNWGTTTNWTPNGTPGTGDKVTITHHITVASAAAIRIIDLDGSGELTLNATLTVDDHADALITIRSDADIFTSNGTAGTPRLIQSASANPTNPWKMVIEDVVGKDTRTLNFAFLKLRGCLFYLGNDTYYQYFGASGDDNPRITSVTPLERPSRIISHSLAGVYGGRVYPDGADPGIMVISGYCSLDSFLATTLKNMVASGQRLSLLTHNYHLPKCFIERATFRERGGLYQEFNITVIEDAT